MKKCLGSRLAVLGAGASAVLLLLGQSRALSQPERGSAPPSHVSIPPDTGPPLKPGDKMLKIILRPKRPSDPEAKNLLENLTVEEKRLLENLINDPKYAEELKADPEKTRRLVEAMKNPSRPQAQDPEIRRLLDQLKKLDQPPDRMPLPSAPARPGVVGEGPAEPPAPPPLPPPGGGPPPGAAPGGMPAPRPGGVDADAPVRNEPVEPEWRRGLLEQLDKLSDQDGPLKDSPVWREAFDDLKVATLHSIDPESGGKLNGEDLDRRLGQWNRALREVNGWTSPARSSLGRLGLPSMPGLRSPRPGSGLGWTRSFGSASVARPSTSGLGASTVLLWLGFAATLAVVLWLLLSRYRKAILLQQGGAWKLGPWPIEPNEIRNRADLIRAFEYLSLLRLGRAARSWNHLEIARRFGSNEPQQRQAATELADIYERARYAPGNEPLPDAALAAARRDLCLLAGVANA